MCLWLAQRSAIASLSRLASTPAVPGAAGLELGGEREEQAFARRRPDELHPGWKPVVALEERHHDRRLPGDIPGRGERGEGCRGDLLPEN